MAAFKKYLQDQTKSICINNAASRSPQHSSPHTRSFTHKNNNNKLCIILENALKENMKTEIPENNMFNGVYEIGNGVKVGRLKKTRHIF